MRTLLIGVIGHVDHGKTALVKALTGIDTDRLKEERARGISIVLGFSHLSLPGGEIDLIDMPGHERFVRTMISGATGMDAALLVVAANEGIRRQTVEHLQIARLLGLSRGIVAITKSDLVTAGVAERVVAESAELMAKHGFEARSAILCSARTGAGIGALAASLAALLTETPEKSADGLSYLPIDRAFAVPGFGTVVTGTLRRGGLRVGEEVEIVPGGRRARIRGLQVHGRSVAATAPGRRTAVNLRGVEQAALKPGQAIARPGLIPLSNWLDVDVTLLEDAPHSLANGASVRLLFGMAETEVRLRLLDRDDLRPGARAIAQLRCPEGAAIPAREHFILRLASPPGTIGGGVVINPLSSRRRRFDREITTRIQALSLAPPDQAKALLLAERGEQGMPLLELAQRLGTTPEKVRGRSAESGASVVSKTGLVIDRRATAAIERRIIETVGHFHRSHPSRAGVMRAQLHHLFPAGPDPATLNEIIARLVERRMLAIGAGLVRLASFLPPPSADAADVLDQGLIQAFLAGGLTPPDWERLASGDGQQRSALERLIRTGILVRAVDRVQKRAVVFHRDAVRQAAVRLQNALAQRPEGLLAGEAGSILGISRKFSIPLLEHFDMIGLTRRYGDRRRLARNSTTGRLAG